MPPSSSPRTPIQTRLRVMPTTKPESAMPPTAVTGSIATLPPPATRSRARWLVRGACAAVRRAGRFAGAAVAAPRRRGSGLRLRRASASTSRFGRAAGRVAGEIAGAPISPRLRGRACAATRRCAEAERGLSAISPALGATPPRVISFASGSRPQRQTGNSGGQTQPRARSARNRLTRRSSSEWNEIAASRPPVASMSHACGSAASIASSSPLTAIRIAWKVRLAGLPRPKRADGGRPARTASTSSEVVARGRCSTISPRDRAGVLLVGVVAERLGDPALGPLVDDGLGRRSRHRGPSACRAARRRSRRSRAPRRRSASRRRRSRRGPRRGGSPRRRARSAPRRSRHGRTASRRAPRGRSARSARSAAGSRSIAISVPSGPIRSASRREWPPPPKVQSTTVSPGWGAVSRITSAARTGTCSVGM